MAITTGDLIKREEELSSYEGADKVVSSIELAEQFSNLPVTTKLQSEIKGLDEAIDGFEPGEVVVVSGPTSNGKTFLCDTIAKNLLRQRCLSLFFTFEVTAKKFVQWHSDESTVIYLPREHLAGDLKWIRERCWEAKIKYGVKAVFIDHLHYVVKFDSPHNMSLVIGNAMRTIKKEIAIDLNLVVFVICHIGKKLPDDEPSINHLRDSSFVGQEADTVLMVWRRKDLDKLGKKMDSMTQGLATVKVEKARRTGAMNACIKLKRDGQRLIESFGEPDEPAPRRRKADQPVVLAGQDWASMESNGDD